MTISTQERVDELQSTQRPHIVNTASNTERELNDPHILPLFMQSGGAMQGGDNAEPLHGNCTQARMHPFTHPHTVFPTVGYTRLHSVPNNKKSCDFSNQIPLELSPGSIIYIQDKEDTTHTHTHTHTHVYACVWVCVVLMR